MPSGWTPSTYDGRDIRFSVRRDEGAPAQKTLKHPFPARTQGDVPCCVSMAIATCMETLDAQRGKVVELSPLFHYFVARGEAPDLKLLDLRTALSVAAATGLCRRDLHDPPCDAAGALQRPSSAAFKDAEKQRLAGYDPGTMRTQYAVLTDPLDEASRDAIARGIPVLVAFWITSAYRALTAAKPVHGPPPAERSEEGHAVTLIGYDDAEEVFLVKDSRGRKFGQGGQWKLPYAVMRSSLVHEAWAIERILYDA